LGELLVLHMLIMALKVSLHLHQGSERHPREET
jgi:hypothetical protein